MRRALVPLIAAAGLAWIATGAVDAHALLVSASPAPNTAVATSPTSLTLTFTESPDPKLSIVHVLDSSGAERSVGGVTTIPGKPDELMVPVTPLPEGVYTVSWRTVSSVDGHVAAGSYAFSVGTAAPPVGSGSGASASGSVQSSSGGSLLTILGRLLLFLGLLGLVGCGITGALLVRGLDDPQNKTILRLAVGETAVAVLGTLLLIAGQITDAGASLADLPASSLGRDAVLRLAPLVDAAVLTLAAWRIDGAGRVRVRRWLVVAAGVSGGLALLVEAVLSHAASETLAPAQIALQWFHLLAVGLWLGGLVVLLIQVRGVETVSKAQIARRFANLAGLGLAAVVATGTLRAIVDIGSLDALFSTDFGRLVLLKVALLIPIAGLGALNHFRNVPAAIRGLGPLRRTGSLEISIGTAILLVAALLVNTAPPAEVSAASQGGGPEAAASATTAPLEVSGTDFGTTVRLGLTVSPGIVGSNDFVARLTDYDTGAALNASAVRFTFRLPERPDVGASTLDLVRQSAGVFSGTGANLSIDGKWSVAALVTEPATSVEVDLMVSVRVPPQQIDVNRVPGLPTIYTAHLGSGRTVQVYLDPGKPGANLLHATWFDAGGHEMPVSDVAMTQLGASGASTGLVPQILDSGHEAAPAQVAAFPAEFVIGATGPDGASLRTQLTITQS
jgi:copper transport protein